MGSVCVTVLSLGGTITMTSDDIRGVRPSLSVDAILATVPALTSIAKIEAKTLVLKPGASLGFDDVYRALAAARQAVDSGANGVVIVQGTDTIEETAYLLDLHWDRAEPLVVTGAMRAPQTPGADGPANLLASVLVAAAPASQRLGVLVVLNDEIHAAARVRKMRSSGPDAFQSPSFGRLGQIEEGAAIFANRPAPWPVIAENIHSLPRVAMLESSLGDHGDLLELIADASYDGAVIAGFGVGHLSSGYALAVERALRKFPVVLATRAGAGTTYTNTYSFAGSEIDLLEKGAIPAGWLDARKARILLIALLAAGFERGEIHDEFIRRGGSPGGPAK